MNHPSRRELYRIVYPLAERPTLEVGRALYEVVDCSELGLRYYVPNRRMPEIGTPVNGILCFRRGAQIAIDGAVIRTGGGLVAIALTQPGTTFYQVLTEQRYLRAKGYTLSE
jgi:hypothetical protein